MTSARACARASRPIRPSFRRPAKRESKVNIHGHRGSRRAVRRTAEELAAERSLGRNRLNDLRAERAKERKPAEGETNAGAPLSRKPQRKRPVTGGFAEGIARAEFGRFYWNARLEGELDAARRRRRDRGGNKRK
jgi:hypothetical protein